MTMRDDFTARRFGAVGAWIAPIPFGLSLSKRPSFL